MIPINTRRVMRARWTPDTKSPNYIKVTAYAEDRDTPYVILEHQGKEIWIEDATAADLVERINRALSILPSSK